MTNALTVVNQNTAIVEDAAIADAIAIAGRIANDVAAKYTFAEYKAQKANNTIDAQRTDLITFAVYLTEVTRAEHCRLLYLFADAWQGITWGLVKGFRQWLLNAGYSITSINRMLSSVKMYAKLATQAGVLDDDENALIHTVTGYGKKGAKHIDDKRRDTGIATRTGAKKAAHVRIDDEQAKALKTQPDTPQGRRDAVIMALLLDHGLRVGELVALDVSAFDMKAGTMTFHRQKVGIDQTHKLTAHAKRILAKWLATDAPTFPDENGRIPLLRGSRKGGALTDTSMNEVTVSERVRTLGAAAGIAGLSAHDCRHYWATYWAKNIKKLDRGILQLQEAGGWSSLAMPRRYVEDAAIANEGMDPGD